MTQWPVIAIQYGWICPLCGQSNAPNNLTCVCGMRESVSTTGADYQPFKKPAAERVTLDELAKRLSGSVATDFQKTAEQSEAETVARIQQAVKEQGEKAKLKVIPDSHIDTYFDSDDNCLLCKHDLSFDKMDEIAEKVFDFLRNRPKTDFVFPEGLSFEDLTENGQKSIRELVKVVLGALR